MKISSFKKLEYENELKKINEDIPNLTEKKQAARAEGDLSENTEYDIASAELEQAITRKSVIETILKEAEVLETGNGPRIGLGSFVELTIPDDPSFGKRILRLDADGITINDDPLNRVLSISSTLGKAINNGISGLYTIQADVGEITYKVQKIPYAEVKRILNVA